MDERVAVPWVQSRKRSRGDEPIVMITAYDEPFARLADEAGVDIILVGDSLAQVVLGYESTLAIGIEDMAHHVAAVARARPRALVVADMPWLSYHTETFEAVRNAGRLVRSGSSAVKLEGGRRRLAAVRAIIEAEIPVMAHLGLTPQSVHAMGGYKMQGRELAEAEELLQDAVALAGAGCFALVLEGVPDVLADRITAEIDIPTIGIGAGGGCDGQVLVLHDLLGLTRQPAARFVRQYLDLSTMVTGAISSYASDVRRGSFPAEAESYHGSSALREAIAARR
ncbi:MAG: 3-methyl-2-oxobutanoate hydroxymethyltransferase [Acidimicrobiales bacterium]